MRKLLRTGLFIIGSTSFGCKPATPKADEGASSPSTAAGTAAVPTNPQPTQAADKEPASASGRRAEIGKPAPDFELSDLRGERVRLSAQRGKIVVLEWFNPECPFVRASHTKGSLVGTSGRHAKSGVVWLAINSGAPGKQGHGVEKNRRAQQDFGMNHSILVDESGEVGRAYGAKTTPHMFVIDTGGTLVYAGAVDNSPDGEGESPQNGKLVNYIESALAALRGGRPVEVSETEPYGCSVKYAK